jgi:antitoxin component of MazEF toxin-antitoxin module
MGADLTLTLSIRPIRLKSSIYFRVPNDIVDLINLEDNSKVTLTLEQQSDRHLLVYSVIKNDSVEASEDNEFHPPRKTLQESAQRSRTYGKS